MENIKIYHSLGKGPIIAAICIIVAGICEIIAEGVLRLVWDGCFKWTPWLIGLFLLALGLTWVIPYWKEKSKKTPFLEVADDKVIMNSLKSWEIPFSEVEEFFFTDITKQLIGIRYKNDEIQKTKNHSIGNKDEISTYRLSMKPQELLDLLSQRLEAYRSTHA